MVRRGPSLEEKQRWMSERQSAVTPPPVESAPGANVTAFERHYRPKDLARLWGLDAGDRG